MKPGKDPHSPGSYRPIALTSVVCKVMEQMITDRLAFILERIWYFVPYQNGFRLGRSATDSVIKLDLDVKKALVNKESIICVFLVIEKAYDSLWKEGILIKLHVAGIKGFFYMVGNSKLE